MRTFDTQPQTAYEQTSAYEPTNGTIQHDHQQPAMQQHQHYSDPRVSPSGRRVPPPPLSLCDRIINCVEPCMDLFVRMVGPVLSLLCISLISLVVYSYFIDVLPLVSARVCHGASDETLRRYMDRTEYAPAVRRGREGIQDARSGRFIAADPRNPNSVEEMLAHHMAQRVTIDSSGCGPTYAVTALGIYLLLNIVFHYFATMFLGPGRPPAHFSNELLDHFASHDPERRDDQHVRECKTCKNVKPMRAHHCRACGKCGLKMDHHCPWVNTCVGWRNHRHFISFLFFLWSGTGFFLLSSIDSVIPILLGTRHHDSTLMFAGIVCVAAFVAGSLFLLWSGYLLLTNQTTIEFYGNQWGAKPGNPYNMGVARNVAQVFGDRPVLALLIPSLAPPPSDGCVYALNAGRGLPLPMLIDERTA